MLLFLFSSLGFALTFYMPGWVCTDVVDAGVTPTDVFHSGHVFDVCVLLGTMCHPMCIFVKTVLW